MKKFLAILMVLSLFLSLAACGGNGDKTPETTAPAQESTEAPAVESTAAPENGPITAKGQTCTITIPAPATFVEGYEITDSGCNALTAVQKIYAKLSKEDPKIEINVTIEQVVVSGAETQDSKGYAEYYNSKKLGTYEPVEIGGYKGYLKAKASETNKTADNWYIIDYPMSDGTSMVLSLYVGQKYADDTSAMAPVAETFLKNVQVAPINA